MNIMQQILQAIQSGTSTPPESQAATEAMLASIRPQAAAPAAQAAFGPDVGGDPAPTPQVTPAPAAQPAPAQPPGVLGTIGHILAPEPGSFWQSALNNGLVNARAGQSQYLMNLQKSVDDRAKEQEATKLSVATRKTAEAKLPTAGYITTPTGSVLRPDAAGNLTTAYEPPVKDGETERLITMWEKLAPGPLRDIVHQAIKGAQYTPEYIAADTARRVAAAKARPRAAARAGSSGLPAGFKLVN